MAEKNETKIEREYTIPLRHRWHIVPRYQRTNKAVKTVKEFLVRHMKIRDGDLDKIKLDIHLNELLWSRGIQNPPSKIRVKAKKEGDIVKVEAAELPGKIKFKKIRAGKVESAAKEVAKKKKSEKTEAVGSEQVQASSSNESRAKESEEKKKDTEEKKEATIEAEEKIEKAEAKMEKHTTKADSPKQEKNLRKGYNQSSRGH
ncbi:50S ribosomal protein L31e [uncultured archaeon]|nr:50S ribosomal protein L31e [uncultured archaeon]